MLPACAGNTSYNIIFIEYFGGNNDLYCENIWQGINEFASERDISCKRISPSANTYEAYYSAVNEAVNYSAEIIVVPGYIFETVIKDAQSNFPDVKFIILDANINTNEFINSENVCSVSFAEQQAGYLAGYAMVKEGFVNLGIMGENIAAVLRYSYGFIMGADSAASEIGTNVNIYYKTTENSAASPDIQNTASEWYNEGVQAIFVCADNMSYSVMASAEEYDDAWVIGCDVDRSSESSKVYTSAIKDFSFCIKYLLEQYYNNGSFISGQILMGAQQDGVGLCMETSLFKNFTVDDYEYQCSMLDEDTVSELPDEESVLHVGQLPVKSAIIVIK